MSAAIASAPSTRETLGGDNTRRARRLTAPAGPVVSIRELTKTFGDHVALDDITLDVEPGSIVGLIGPSGCGKTTLARSVLGLVAPTRGEVRVFGRDPQRLSSRDRGRLAYMPQLPVLFPNLSVYGNLTFMASLRGAPIGGRRRRLQQLLEFVDLGQHAHKRLADCSGGMQRRLTLAATLVNDPEVVILDEPTAGVDPILRDRFWAQFRELRNAGRTLIVPTQYVGEAVSCDMVAIISDGQLISYSSPEQLRNDAFHGDPLRLELRSGWLPHDQMERIAELEFVQAVRRHDDDLLIVVDDAERDRPALERHLATLGLPPVALERIDPSFDQIFVELISRHRSLADAADRTDREPAP